MAISARRLEELIGQGATIWNDEWEEIKLDKNTCEICELQYLNGTHMGWCLQFQYDYEDEHHKTEVNLEYLEEDVEKGRWELEMTATRTETFAPPIYEEFENNNDIVPVYTKKHLIYHLYYYIDKFKGKIILIERVDAVDNDIIFNKPLTKENYIEACKLCKKLFLGEGEEV